MLSSMKWNEYDFYSKLNSIRIIQLLSKIFLLPLPFFIVNYLTFCLPLLPLRLLFSKIYHLIIFINNFFWFHSNFA
jgi:hypothetical protein